MSGQAINNSHYAPSPHGRSVASLTFLTCAALLEDPVTVGFPLGYESQSYCSSILYEQERADIPLSNLGYLFCHIGYTYPTFC